MQIVATLWTALLHSAQAVLYAIGWCVQALMDFATVLAGDTPKTRADVDLALTAAGGLDDPALAGLSEPQKYVRAENLRQRVQTAQDTAETEVGKALGVEIGFNSADVD